MNDVELVFGEHAIKIRVPVRNGVTNCELLGEDRLEVANRGHACHTELLNFLDVAIGDFAAANYADIQHRFLTYFSAFASCGRDFATIYISRRDEEFLSFREAR
jgi:hypothetical protein